MPQATIARTVTYTLTQPEIIAYGDLVNRRRARSTGRPPRSMLSAVYIPLLLGAILIVVRAGHADFGPMLVAGTIAYLGGVLGLRHEVLQKYDLRLAECIRTELHRGPRHVTLGDATLESSIPGISARLDYSAFIDFEVSRGFILGWLDDAGAMPVPIRAFASTAEADAFAGEMRSRIAAARSTDTRSSA